MPSPRPSSIRHNMSKVNDDAMKGVTTVDSDQRKTAKVITVLPPNLDAALAPII